MKRLKTIATRFLGLDDLNKEEREQLLEITSQREKLKPSQTKFIEDPIIKQLIYSNNQSAYLIDAEQFY